MSTLVSANEIIAYASLLKLSRNDIKILNIKDTYALHKVIFGLFENIRSNAAIKAGESSGILYADKGGDFHTRHVIMLSTRKPHATPQFGRLDIRPIPASFLAQERYAFEVTLNPVKRENQSRKIVPLRDQKSIAQWFEERATTSWGFEVKQTTLEVSHLKVQRFTKDGSTVTHGSATLKGELQVTNREKFTYSFLHGIGKGRAFGFGLLQIVPLVNH
jgi:CRISPR system Cascade subunit CasE